MLRGTGEQVPVSELDAEGRHQRIATGWGELPAELAAGSAGTRCGPRWGTRALAGRAGPSGVGRAGSVLGGRQALIDFALGGQPVVELMARCETAFLGDEECRFGNQRVSLRLFRRLGALRRQVRLGSRRNRVCTEGVLLG